MVTQVQVVEGPFHQGQTQSPFAGMQCTGIAYFSLITVFLQNLGTLVWDSNTVDLAVAGHAIYQEIIATNSDRQPRYTGTLI